MPQTSHRSTERVLSIIEYLSSSSEGYTLTEIAQRLDAPKSSILPMLQTMVARGFAELNYHTNRYSIGLNLFFAASTYRSRISANRFIDLEMQQLSHRIGESCCLGVMQGKNVLFIHRTDFQDSVICRKAPGQVELGCLGAMGKALFCDFTLAELSDIFLGDGGTLPPNLNLYRAHIQMEETRLTGLSYEYGEVEHSIQCIAAPIRLEEKIVASLGIILPTFRMSPEKAIKCSQALPVSARRIENVLSTSDEDIHDIFSSNGFRNL